MTTNTETAKDFADLVTMTPKQLQHWLDTEESKSVGYVKEGERESVGHQSGRRIIAILETPKRDYTEADYDHMAKVVGYIKRHLAQRPDGDIEHTPWRYSLMNWGHDPLKR